MKKINFKHLVKAMFFGTTKYFTLLIVSLIFGSMMFFAIAGFMNVNPLEKVNELLQARTNVVEQGGTMASLLDWKLLGLVLLTPMIILWGNQVWMKYNELEGKHYL